MAKTCTCSYLLPDLECETGQELVRAMTEALEAHRVYVERRAPIELLNNLEYDGLEAAAESAIAAYRQHCPIDNWRRETEAMVEEKRTFVMTEGDEAGKAGIIYHDQWGFAVANMDSSNPHGADSLDEVEALINKLGISKNHWK